MLSSGLIASISDPFICVGVMKNLNLNLIIVVLLSLGINSFAQKTTTQDPLQKAVVNLYAQILVQPEEKIYIQTDKPYYMNGERMYFRAFPFHASTLKLANWNRYIYVELVSPVDTVVLRQQICISDDKIFYGTLDLPETLPEGTYTLRSYSRYSANAGEAFFFSRPVFIADPNAEKIEIEQNFSQINDKQVSAELKFKDAKTGEIKNPESLTIVQNNGKKSNFSAPSLKDGTYNEKFAVSESSSERVILIDYKNGNKSFEKYISIPCTNSFPEINFYPEGGQMIAGTNSRVAFKTLLPGAEPANIDGTVYNSKNEQVSQITTLHDGMGTFSFTPLTGEKYYAQCNFKGQTLKIDLPDVKPEGYAIRTDWEGDSLALQINHSSNTSPQKCYLLIHHQGIPIYLKAYDFSQSIKRLNKKLFITGVSHVLLLDSTLHPLSERLVFNNQKDQIDPEVSVTKSLIKPREQTTLGLKFQVAAADSIPPSFAISVTDDKDVKLDTTTNIISEILLSSELRGHIANPLFYFSDAPQATAFADLLMLTNGWRRYNVAEALQNSLQKPQIKPEQSQSISGTIKGRFGKTYKGANIKLMAIGYKYNNVVESNDQGQFEFSDFEFPDSTAYFLMCYNNKGKTDDIMEISLDPPGYPAVAIPTSNNHSMQISHDQLSEYVLKANNKYLNDKGMRQIDLPEVEIKAKRKEVVKRIDNKTGASDPDLFLSSESLESMPPSSFDELFTRIPGVSATDGDGVRVRSQTAQFVLNGIPLHCTYAELPEYVSLSEIAQVDLYKDISNTLIFGASGAPVLALTTWPPGVNVKKQLAELTNRKLILPLGYQKTVEFYSPTYDTPSAKNSLKPDLRSTIYWKPNLQSDATGNSSVSFYSADAETTYSVIVEGFSNNRKLIYSRKNAIIKVKK